MTNKLSCGADVLFAISGLVVTGSLTSNSNVAVFDIFDSVCPAGEDYCYPDNGSSFLYRDRDHFNSLGSQLLAEPFVDLLRSSGMLTPAR